MLALCHGVGAGQLARQCCRRRTGLAQQPAGNLLVVPDDERARDHAQHDRSQQRLYHVGRDQLVAQQDGEKRESEFTADTDHDSGAQGFEEIAGETLREERDDQGLADNKRNHQT